MQIVSQWHPSLPTLDNIEEIEIPAQDICRILKEAIQVTGTRPNRGRGKSVPWWTPEFKYAGPNYKDVT